MLYSAGMLSQGTHYLKLQLLWCSLGLIACLFVTFIDYKHLKKAAPFFFVIALVLLALVMAKAGSRNGAKRWLIYGGFSFQPSEAAKIALIVALASYGSRFQRLMPTFTYGLVFPGLIVVSIVSLIFVEPDRGTTILLAAVTFSMLLVAGSNMKFVIPCAIAGVAALIVSILNDPMRLGRIMAWLHPQDSKAGTGYQAWHATLALGAGGTTGLGLGSGRQKLGFIPEQHTDFIFSMVGEELGLIATLSVVAVFFVFVICGTIISLRARDRFGLLLGTGLTFLIGFQAFINIGVVTSLLPNKGLALPFVSYGGSSLLMTLICVGILLSIAVHAELQDEEEPEFKKERRSNVFA
ncbi:MAG: putative lipid flippase FtsW [Verrucomicrobiales bacterium]|nr:putative lipid flippase FtsW [Verrucomicrobiales bacterium]